jgi:hypothetical protein
VWINRGEDWPFPGIDIGDVVPDLVAAASL